MNPAVAVPIIPVITKFGSRIIRILGCNPGSMTLQGTNTYLIGTGKRRILLDAGDADKPKFIKNLRAVLRKESIKIDAILVTHWHHDHIGGVKDVLAIDDTDVWKYPRTDASDTYSEILPSEKLQQLSNGQEFRVEGATLKIVHTPGHTTDHVVVTLAEENALFSGDCILGEGTTVFEDLHDYMRSLDTILKLKPSVIYPGHGNVINDPYTKIKAYIDHRMKRENQIIEVLKQTPDKKFNEIDIVKVIYTDTPEELWPAAAFNVNHHLCKLTKENRIVESETDGTVWQYKENVSRL